MWLVKTFPAICGTTKFITMITRACQSPLSILTILIFMVKVCQLFHSPQAVGPHVAMELQLVIHRAH
jgi:hypothetical protein